MTKLPVFVKTVIESGSPTKGDLLRAAEMARDSGYPRLATTLARKSAVIGEVRALPSPWKDVPDAAWTSFVQAMSVGKPNEINPKGFFGVFQIGVRRLCDLGVMTAAKARNARTPNGGITRIWDGTWLIPRERFLADPAFQYKIFVKSMDLYRNVIAEKYKQVIGLEIEPGKTATLSGLLAVAHKAGSEGMHKWLTSGDIRKKFPWVTVAYDRVNKIF